DALLPWTFVDEDSGNHQVVNVEMFGLLLGIGNRRAQNLLDVTRHTLLGEFQNTECLADALAADLVYDQPSFLRRNSHVFVSGACFHRFTWISGSKTRKLAAASCTCRRRCRLRAAGNRRGCRRRGSSLRSNSYPVPLESAGRGELAQLVSHHVLRDVHGDELLAIVDG